MSSIPDTFVEGGGLLDEKLAEEKVPVIEVPGLNYLGEINMQKTRGNFPGLLKKGNSCYHWHRISSPSFV